MSRSVHLLDPGLPWQQITLAGGRPPIRRLVLHTEGGGGASVQAVEFPAGWVRPEAGCFDADEEIVVVRGSLVVSGVELRAGDHAFVPRGALRVDSRSGHDGCLAVAWFSSPPRWRRVNQAGPVDVRCRPLGRPSASCAGDGSKVVVGPADVIVPREAAWSWVPEGQPVVRPGAPALARSWG